MKEVDSQLKDVMIDNDTVNHVKHSVQLRIEKSLEFTRILKEYSQMFGTSSLAVE